MAIHPLGFSIDGGLSLWIMYLRMLKKIFLSFGMLIAVVASGQQEDLFESNEPLEFTLRGDLAALLSDRGDQVW